MRLYCAILTIQIIEAYSATKISVLNDDEPLTVATVNIVNRCFRLSEHWSELLITHEHPPREILRKIHHESMTSISIVSLDKTENSQFTHSGECNDHFNTGVEWQETKPTAVIITIRSLRQLESILDSLKNDIQRIWRPRSYFVIILETRCNAEECNQMFKFIWDSLILNAIILCSSNNPANRNHSEIKLLTFNPYSVDHSPQWEIIIHEIVEVSLNPNNFNHSWYIFQQTFTEIRSSEDCGTLFFDKSLNLDRYVIPISYYHPNFLLDQTLIGLAERAAFAEDRGTLKTLASKLRFEIAQVGNNTAENYGRLLTNGSYDGILGDLCKGRSHLIPTMRGLKFYPGLEMTYPHGTSGVCLASRIAGNRPQWTNLADAKHIWITLGLGLLFSAAILYLQNKSRGIVSALLDAERLIIGTSIIRMPTVIKHRMILGSIFLVVLVVDGTIRGRFISILTITRPNANLNTLEQVKDQGVALYGHARFRDLFTDFRMKVQINISLRFPACLNDPESRETQRACLIECKVLHFPTANRSNIYKAPEPILSGYTVFLTMMHWPLMTRYSFDVQKLVEAGILKKWRLDTNRELEVDAWKVKRAAELTYVRPTKLNDVLPAFVLLFVGLLAALIVFIWEIKSGKNLRGIDP